MVLILILIVFLVWMTWIDSKNYFIFNDFIY